MIIEDAKRNATSIVHEALLKAEKVEYQTLIMKKNLCVYKSKIKSLIEAQLELNEELEETEDI